MVATGRHTGENVMNSEIKTEAYELTEAELHCVDGGRIDFGALAAFSAGVALTGTVWGGYVAELAYNKYTTGSLLPK
jgi:lactobin A/cerein 7B family class IIb bacteriocin